MMPVERLEAWQAARRLVLAVYAETKSWPDEERYGMIAQARRAAVSVPANLAEGCARLGPKELRRFADVALGSLAELATLLRLAQDLGYTSPERWEALDQQRNAAGRLVFGIARAASRAGHES